MDRFPGESWNHYNGRLVEANRAQRRLDLQAARLEAERTGKQPFDSASFRQAYHSVRPYSPDYEEMEAEGLSEIIAEAQRQIDAFLGK